MGAVWRGGFEPGTGLREGKGRKIYFVGRYFAPTWGNRPEYVGGLFRFYSNEYSGCCGILMRGFLHYTR